MSTATFNLVAPARIREAGDFIEDLEWLASFGVSWGEIARRLGLSEVALERKLYRYGRNDLVRALKPRFDR